MKLQCQSLSDSDLTKLVGYVETYDNMSPKEVAEEYVEAWEDDADCHSVLVTPLDAEARALPDWTTGGSFTQPQYLVYEVIPEVTWTARKAGS